jgi:hypothetical protein
MSINKYSKESADCQVFFKKIKKVFCGKKFPAGSIPAGNRKAGS